MVLPQVQGAPAGDEADAVLVRSTHLVITPHPSSNTIPTPLTRLLHTHHNPFTPLTHALTLTLTLTPPSTGRPLRCSWCISSASLRAARGGASWTRRSTPS